MSERVLSRFPSQMSIEDLMEMSNSIPEECATSLQPTTADHGQLASAIRAPLGTPGKIPTVNHKTGEQISINYEAPLTTKLRMLLDTHALSDVTLLVGPGREPLHAHKIILALSSPVFTAMFYGDLSNTNEVPTTVPAQNMNINPDAISHSLEDGQTSSKNPLMGKTSNTTVEIPDCTVSAMEAFLRFVYYNGSCESTSTISQDHALSLLYAARKYNVYGLEDLCIVTLSKCLSGENVFDILHASSFYDIPSLHELCWEYIEDNVVDVINAHLNYLTHATIQKIFSKERLSCKEVDLFKVFMKWAKKECAKINLNPTPENIRSSFESELELIRFPTMSGAEFAEVVVPTGVLTMEQVAQIFVAINSSEEKMTEITKGNSQEDPNSTASPCSSILKGMNFSCHKRTTRRPVVLNDPQDFATGPGTGVTHKLNAINRPPVFTFMAEQSANLAENNHVSFQPGTPALAPTPNRRPQTQTTHMAGAIEFQIPGMPGTLNAVPIEVPTPAPVVPSGERHRGRSRTRRHRRRETNDTTEEE